MQWKGEASLLEVWLGGGSGIKGFFDNLDHKLLLKAVNRHTTTAWYRLSIKRWLKAPVSVRGRHLPGSRKGTPQGGVISPLLADLYFHNALDLRMARSSPTIVFERYADDVVVQARNQGEAAQLKQAIGDRLSECKLELHPEKTKIVLCMQWNSTRSWSNQTFDFLGYGFRPRHAVNRKRGRFTGFLPAVSKKALKRMRQAVRDWQLRSWCHREMVDISDAYSAIIRGWMQYYSLSMSIELQPS